MPDDPAPDDTVLDDSVLDDTVLAAAVLDPWTLRPDAVRPGRGQRGVRVDATLPPSRSVCVLSPVDGPGVVVLSPERARTLGLVDGGVVGEAGLRTALRAAGVHLNDPDHLFHLPVGALPADGSRPAPTGTEPGARPRRLTEDDAAAFARLESTVPADDLDEAFVELGHWRVVGTYVEDRLVCVASAIRWAGTGLADIGVVTLPSERGRGLATRTVRALCAEIRARGCEPQYRCQLDNVASVGLARAAGLVELGTVELVDPDA